MAEEFTFEKFKAYLEKINVKPAGVFNEAVAHAEDWSTFMQMNRSAIRDYVFKIMNKESEFIAENS